MQAVWRILDANANRASEGCRTVEEYARFLLEDALLARSYKQLRHQLQELIQQLGPQRLLLARDAAGDIGAPQPEQPDEAARATPLDVATAAQKRLEQALRCLAEYARLVAPEAVPLAETLRFRAYEMGRALGAVRINRRRLQDARLYVLVEPLETPEALESFCRGLCAAGADILQLRAKDRDDRRLLEDAAAMRRATSAEEKLLIINDRVDICRLSGADGAHLGQEDLTPAAARRILGPSRLIGVSTHDLEQARQAVLDGADYLGYGPCFPSGTKQFNADELAGLQFVRQATAEITLPGFGIGGVTAVNAAEVLEAGAHGVAVCGAVIRAADPAAAVAALRGQIDPCLPRLETP